MTVERAHRILNRIEPGVWTRADVERLLPALRQWARAAVGASAMRDRRKGVARPLTDDQRPLPTDPPERCAA